MDEALLDEVESSAGEDVLRFWESATPFVVLGAAQVLRQEVDEEACLKDGVAIMRRCSGGGCVLQGPGCLNFAAILTYAGRPDLRSFRGSYRLILGRLAKAFEDRGFSVSRAGVSDLALDGGKVSGNAQCRRQKTILHHGTLLYGMGAAGMGKYLREPVKRPVWRRERPHHTFVGRIDADPAVLRAVVCEAFGGGTAAPLEPRVLDAARKLAIEKYATRKWIYRR
ncbi:MAG TPA: lipoate--protein ligase family protein [Candidatus Hydrogenedentes bacterium]|nr:lipoate--protein ligase family protein [Candidatus Hydrogenedentota bacterium]